MENDKFAITGYCRISVDDELNKENTSIENQKHIIEDYVRKNFPNSSLAFYEDRDKSGYTFEHREEYQKMRKKLVSHQYDILIIKDFSRFSRRNGRGLVELEDLRDAGVRIISVGDNIDYPTNDDWLQIQLHFFINEMPVTETSKKIKNVINQRQKEAKWICNVPYGYVMTNSKNMTFEIDTPAAEIVKKIFALYNEGLGYRKIANYLTDLHIPTPRMTYKNHIEKNGTITKIQNIKKEWSIISVQEILTNDFYIGTLRQRKYTRNKINGTDKKLDDDKHIVFENNHEAIVDYMAFKCAQEQIKKRSTNGYRGIKLYDNVYTGFLFCGDCGSPMFSRSRPELSPAYICGLYHRRGLKGCTAHHIKVDTLNDLIKTYVEKVKNNSQSMIEKLELLLKDETKESTDNSNVIDKLQKQLNNTEEELKTTKRQKIREITKKPEDIELIEKTYEEMEYDLEQSLKGIKNQISMLNNRQTTILRVNRIARTAIDIFDDIIQKPSFTKTDLELIIDKIIIYDNHIEIKLKRDIDTLLSMGKLDEYPNFSRDTKNNENESVIQKSNKHENKVLSVNVVSGGDPLEIYTDHEGEVIFKKYSPIEELAETATQYAEAMNKACGISIIIVDRDIAVACAGIPKKDILEHKISSEIDNIIDTRQLYAWHNGERKISVTDRQEKYFAKVIAPIFSEGDIIGAVAVVEAETLSEPTETEIKLVQTAAVFLGKQLEN
ncbi:MAG: recombinase family protein [Oscillospiraceae bacterium]|nr:recombinase family protein [Oscillospiraceae bacterium]